MMSFLVTRQRARWFVLPLCAMLVTSCAADSPLAGETRSSAPASKVAPPTVSLTDIESLYVGVLPWMARLYDAQSGGFYESLATRAHPKGAPDIQSTLFAVEILNSAELLKSAPPAASAKMVNYFRSRQNAQTGFFSDPGYPKMVGNERVMGRALQFSLLGLKSLNSQPLYALPGARDEPLPERFVSEQNLEKWLDDRGWEQPWSALDAVSSQKSYLLTLPAEKREPLVKFIYDYVVAKQDPATGFVGGDKTIVQISGMAKFGWFCNAFELPLPRADADYASVMKWYRSKPKVETMTMIRNPIHHLADLQPFLSKPMPEADKAIVVRETARLLKPFLQPDGAFSMQDDKFQLVPNGLWPKLGMAPGPQSDLNGTSQGRVIREKAYEMMGVATPPMAGSATFWEKMKSLQ